MAISDTAARTQEEALASVRENEHEEERTAAPTITGTGEVLQDTTSTGRAAPWAERKQQNMVLSDMYLELHDMNPDSRVFSHEKIGRVADCGRTLLVGVDEQGKKKLVQAYFCKDRLCPVCNWRKSLLLFHQTQQQANWISSNTQPPARQHWHVEYLFLTLTIVNTQNTPDALTNALDALQNGFRRVINGKAGKLSHKLTKTLLGASRAIEITYNTRTDTLHPHIHAILAVKSSYFCKALHQRLTRTEWRQLWQEACGLDYLPQCDCKRIDNTARGVAECSKYPVKVLSVINRYEKLQHDSYTNARTNDARAKLLRAVESISLASYKRRFIEVYGCFRAARRMLKQQDIDTADLAHVSDDRTAFEPVEYHLYRWRACVGAYIC